MACHNLADFDLSGGQKTIDALRAENVRFVFKKVDDQNIVEKRKNENRRDGSKLLSASRSRCECPDLR